MPYCKLTERNELLHLSSLLYERVVREDINIVNDAASRALSAKALHNNISTMHERSTTST